eukprot:Gb_12191 [translate_table: standard]
MGMKAKHDEDYLEVSISEMNFIRNDITSIISQLTNHEHVTAIAGMQSYNLTNQNISKWFNLEPRKFMVVAQKKFNCDLGGGAMQYRSARVCKGASRLHGVPSLPLTRVVSLLKDGCKRKGQAAFSLLLCAVGLMAKYLCEDGGVHYDCLSCSLWRWLSRGSTPFSTKVGDSWLLVCAYSLKLDDQALLLSFFYR